ncbi:MAG: response regulator [Anaerolineae bacterium]|nr:response regulator [Anaerolineae bacterium]
MTSRPSPGDGRSTGTPGASRPLRRRVLVVGDECTDASIRSALDPTWWDIEAVRTGWEGLSARRMLLPDAILVDLDLPDMTGAEFCRLLSGSADATSTPIIVLGDDAGVSGRVASLRAGAFDYLVKPPDPAELAARIEAALDLRGESMGKIIAVCGSKGGVGASTIAVNCAASLCWQGGVQTVLVDAGARTATADVLLNLHPAQDGTVLAERLEELDPDDITSFLTPHESGLEVLLLPSGRSRNDGHRGLRRTLLTLRRLRPFVVVDAASGIAEWVAVSVELADVVLLVFTPELAALRGVGLFLEQAKAVGLPPERILLILNRYPLPGGLDRPAIESVLGAKVTHTVPDDVRLVTYSANRGLPFVLSHARSPVARHVAAISAGLAEAMPGRSLKAPREPALCSGRC